MKKRISVFLFAVLLLGCGFFLYALNFAFDLLIFLGSVIEVAGAEVPFLDLLVGGRDYSAHFHALIATGVELTALGGIDGRGNIAL